MPRPCAVEIHAHCHRDRDISQMPRPCAVEIHARCYGAWEDRIGRQREI